MSPRGGYRPGAGRKASKDPGVSWPCRVTKSKLRAYRKAAKTSGKPLRQWAEQWLDDALARSGEEEGES